MVNVMITGNETIKQLLNKRQSKDYDTKNDTYINSLLYGYLNLNADKNGCNEIDNELVDLRVDKVSNGDLNSCKNVLKK